jgi:hypothetical protein
MDQSPSTYPVMRLTLNGTTKPSIQRASNNFSRTKSMAMLGIPCHHIVLLSVLGWL